jgi:hypothetical protein
MHDIDVQTTQVDEWHHYLLHMNLWRVDFARLLLSNCDPLNLWWNNKLITKGNKNDSETNEDKEDEIVVSWSIDGGW